MFSSAQSFPEDQVRKIGEAHVSSDKVHGLAIGIYFQGEAYSFGFGETEEGSKELPNAESIFEIGQLSQVFTTTLMTQLAYQGKLNPERALSEFLSEDFPLPIYQDMICLPGEPLDPNNPKTYSPYHKVFCYPVYGSPPGQITFCQAASHTSGLQTYLKNHRKRCKNHSLNDIKEELKGKTLKNPPGMQYQYSEVGMALLGYTLEQICQQSYDEMLDDHLGTPLGLKDTRVHSGPGIQDRLIKGHKRSGKTISHCTSGALAPAIGLRSSIRDLLLFLQANLEPEDSVLAQVMQEVQQARIDLNEEDINSAEGGYGWIISRFEGIPGQVTWQEGQTPGFSSWLGFNRQSGIGVILLSNSTHEVNKTGLDLLRMLHKSR